MTGSTVLIFLATTWGGLTFPWSSPQVLSLLIIGGIGMVLFFVIERYWLKGPTVRIPSPGNEYALIALPDSQGLLHRSNHFWRVGDSYWLMYDSL